MTPQDLTVIIPTFNRLDTLRLCLAALEAQTVSGFEVIVVDDGSTDGTPEALRVFQGASALRLKHFTQPNGGPAKARNLALSHTTTHLGLLIGDDIVATPAFIENHLAFHRQHPEISELALGWTPWEEQHQVVTPFMRWYEKLQFDYNRLMKGLPPTWLHAYTSNLSFKAQLLRDNPFDERFRAAAWEDTELAFRLYQRKVFHLTFLPSAKAGHVHPTTFKDAVRRAQTLGEAQSLFRSIQPDASIVDAAARNSRICAILGRMPRVLRVFTALAEQLPIPGRFHTFILRAHQQRACEKAACRAKPTDSE